MIAAAGLTEPQRRALVAMKRNGGSLHGLPAGTRIASQVSTALQKLGLVGLGGEGGIFWVLTPLGAKLAAELDLPPVEIDPARKTCRSAHRHHQCAHTRIIRHTGGHTWVQCAKEPTHALVREDGTVYESDCGGVDGWCEAHARDAARRARFSFALIVTPIAWKAP